MSILLVNSNPIVGQSIAYNTVSVISGEFYYGLNQTAASSVSSVLLQTLDIGFSGANPSVTFELSGVTTPYTMTKIEDLARTETLSYYLTVDNTYAHGTTDVVNITSIMTAYANVSAGTVLNNTETSSYNAFGFNDGTVVALGDVVGPDPVSSFNAVGGDKSVRLTWINPSVGSGWASTKIEQSTTGAVTAVGDGTVVYTGTASATVVSVPVLGTEVYYYGAYGVDAFNNPSTVVSTTPAASSVPTWGRFTSLAEHSRLYVEDII